MPIVQEIEINFDEMSDSELALFLQNLREESSKRRTRSEAKIVKASPAPKAPKRNFIKIDL